MTDISYIHPRHEEIDLKLQNWARWVTVKRTGWAMQPIFKQYRAPRQWESDLHIPIPIDGLHALQIERAVSFLPEKQRTALRWAYVFSFVPVNKVRRELGVTLDGLGELIDSARDMLKNRLKYKPIERDHF